MKWNNDHPQNLPPNRRRSPSSSRASSLPPLPSLLLILLVLAARYDECRRGDVCRRRCILRFDVDVANAFSPITRIETTNVDRIRRTVGRRGHRKTTTTTTTTRMTTTRMTTMWSRSSFGGRSTTGGGVGGTSSPSSSSRVGIVVGDDVDVVVPPPTSGSESGSGSGSGPLRGDNTWIVQWRGEGTEGYSDALRQLEFESAFRAELEDYYQYESLSSSSLVENLDDDNDDDDDDDGGHKNMLRFDYVNALSFPYGCYASSWEDRRGGSGEEEGVEYDNRLALPPTSQIKAYESGMQYVTISEVPPSRYLDVHVNDNDATTSITPKTKVVKEGTKKTRGVPAPLPPLDDIFKRAIRRCSLVRAAFRIVAVSCTYEGLADEARRNGSFEDLITILDGGEGDNAVQPTWSIRLRRYGIIRDDDARDDGDEDANQVNDHRRQQQQQQQQRRGRGQRRRARFGKNARSPLREERDAILSMAELVRSFRGRVDLVNPTCGIYILEGLKHPPRDDTSNNDDPNVNDATKDICGRDVGNNDGGESKLLARVVAKGPKTSIYGPKTRICITTTPLCHIASFAMCNVARLRRSMCVLDPFAGSCATLLAASHITSRSSSRSTISSGLLAEGGCCCRSVAIDIAHNGQVDRNDIVRDFVSRSLPPPLEIIHGDCLSPDVRRRARAAIGGRAFDVICTDPPYGIREAMMSGEGEGGDGYPPLTQLFHAIGHDRTDMGAPLLRVGGRLVAFVPVRKNERLEDCLPDLEARECAGLVMEGQGKEQVLNESLSRFLVSFICVS